MRIHRVYCKLVSEPNNVFNIDELQSKHLIKALRLKEDDFVEVFDGYGRSAKCKIIQITKKNCQLERISKLNNDVGPKRVLTAVVPFIKKNNFNFMIQKLTEIGVNKFIIYKPDLVDQSIAKKDLRLIIAKTFEIIVSVCKQCGNNFLPEIFESKNLENALALISKGHGIYFFDTDAEKYFNQDELDKSSSITFITGPESGFSETELKLMNKSKIKKIYLGRNILRSETAAIYISTLIKNHFGKI